jgi:hypothetical protein
LSRNLPHGGVLETKNRFGRVGNGLEQVHLGELRESRVDARRRCTDALEQHSGEFCAEEGRDLERVDAGRIELVDARLQHGLDRVGDAQVA